MDHYQLVQYALKIPNTLPILRAIPNPVRSSRGNSGGRCYKGVSRNQYPQWTLSSFGARIERWDWICVLIRYSLSTKFSFFISSEQPGKWSLQFMRIVIIHVSAIRYACRVNVYIVPAKSDAWYHPHVSRSRLFCPCKSTNSGKVEPIFLCLFRLGRGIQNPVSRDDQGAFREMKSCWFTSTFIFKRASIFFLHGDRIDHYTVTYDVHGSRPTNPEGIVCSTCFIPSNLSVSGIRTTLETGDNTVFWSKNVYGLILFLRSPHWSEQYVNWHDAEKIMVDELVTIIGIDAMYSFFIPLWKK